MSNKTTILSGGEPKPAQNPKYVSDITIFEYRMGGSTLEKWQAVYVGGKLLTYGTVEVADVLERLGFDVSASRAPESCPDFSVFMTPPDRMADFQRYLTEHSENQTE